MESSSIREFIPRPLSTRQAQMFLGQHNRSLDAKGRVILPAELREPFEGGAVLTKSIDGCLALRTPEEFQRVASEVMEKARRGPTERNVARSFLAGAKQLELDRQGRIPIPAHLRDFASLDSEVIVTGQFNRVEIWNPDRWERVDDLGDSSLTDATDNISDVVI